MRHILRGHLIDFKYSYVFCLLLVLIKNTYCQKTCLNGGVLVSAPASGIDQVCVCNKNYVGTRCEITLSNLNQQDKNKLGCQLRPCWIGSTCEDRNDTFVCHCSANTYGDYCEQSSLKIDNPCSSKPCYNNGTCIQQDQNSYTCSCQGSYGGNSCKQNLYGACASNPCQRDGICVPIGLTDYSCQCPDWTIGKNCEVVFNPCSRVSCQNGGNCLKKRTLAFECNCTSDYTGILCDQPVRESCLYSSCQNGQCKVNSTGQYSCSCNTPGYTGQYCQTQQCSPSCKYGTCNRDSSGNYYCQCQSNYNGNDCGSLVCFSGSTMVEHQEKGFIKISDLKEGDYIKTYDETTRQWIFSKFITYLHINPKIVGQYIKLMTSGNKSLTISHYHYIAKTSVNNKVEFVFAKDLNVNDMLITEDNSVEYVTRIDQVYEEGAYAPLTESGTLAVNSIYASCYANAWDNSWIHVLFQPIIQMSKYFTSVKFYNEISDLESAESGMFWYARFFFNLLPYIPFSSSLVYF